MTENTSTGGIAQGFGELRNERLPLPPMDTLNEDQKTAAMALINGPRKGVIGPFVPLLRTPELLDRVAKLGEAIRFNSGLDPRIRELLICATARHVSNQFEWTMHAPLAVQAGVAEETIEALRVGARPGNATQDQVLALDFAQELLASHGVSDPTYQALLDHLGESAVVEITVLIGYFAMVSWVMNVARTPSQSSASGNVLSGLPR